MSLQSQQVVSTSAGASIPIPIDLRTFKFGVGILVNVASGVTCSYNVEVSGDKKQSPLNTWNLHDVLQNKTASANSSLAYPCTMVRLNVVNTNGAITLSVVQVTG